MPTGGGYRIGPYRLDPRSRSLLKNGVDMSLQPRLLDLLEVFVSRPGELLTKDHLVKIGWPNREAADHSLTQAVSQLRRALAEAPGECFQNVARRGYRFIGPLIPEEAPVTDADLDALVAPHLVLLDGRALLESLTLEAVDLAMALFVDLVKRDPTRPLPHVGLANAWLLRYERSRSSDTPDLAALDQAGWHAREARRLGPRVGQAWSVHGFVQFRKGETRDSLAALIEATTLEPDSWANFVRLGWCTWGEQRARAARRALELYAGLAVARWLLATVLVARHELGDAEREVDIALAALPDAPTGFSGAGINALKALLCLARGAIDEALLYFDRELALESRGHIYGRECCALAWYGKAGAFFRRGDRSAAIDALREALTRLPRFPMALAVLFALTGSLPPDATAFASAASQPGASSLSPIDAAMARAVIMDMLGDSVAAAALVAGALRSAPGGNAGWTLAVDPFLYIQRHPETWRAATAELRARTTGWL